MVPSDLSIVSVFGAQLAALKQVSRFNASTGGWEHYVKEASFNQFDTLEVGRGYAVYVTAPITLSLTGSVASWSLSLVTGKSLIGNASSSPKSLAQLLNNLLLTQDKTLPKV